LIAKLVATPFAFHFNAAVRLLQSNFRAQPRIGHSTSPTQDPVRFAQSPALDFAAATIEAVQQKDSERPPVFYSRHFGLFGSNGPLPLCFTEFARERIQHHGDPTFAAFCNVFHHRLISFFFRAWADAQKTVDFDRPTDQHWSHFVGGLVGIGMDSLQNRSSVPDRAKLYFAGRLVQQTRNAEGLEAIVQDFFNLPTEVQTFSGRWLDLPAGSECRLGGSRSTGTLGMTTIVGARVWTCQIHFRLRLGPMSFAEFQRMLPNGQSFHRLCDWVREYAGEQYSWDVHLVLAKEEVPVTQMGRAGRLGWTTWLKTKPFERDADELILQEPADEVVTIQVPPRSAAPMNN
jgi:type VI secretion system protein ImpH